MKKFFLSIAVSLALAVIPHATFAASSVCGLDPTNTNIGPLVTDIKLGLSLPTSDFSLPPDITCDDVTTLYTSFQNCLSNPSAGTTCADQVKSDTKAALQAKNIDLNQYNPSRAGQACSVTQTSTGNKNVPGNYAADGTTCDTPVGNIPASGGSYDGSTWTVASGYNTATPPASAPTCPTDNPNCNLQYTPLEPLPGIIQNGQTDIGSLVKGFFQLAISIGGLLAVLVLVIGGLIYMTSSKSGSMSDAKRHILGALWGLLILLGAFLLLNTINPNLTIFSNTLNPPPAASSQ